jgi:phage terminase large subunit
MGGSNGSALPDTQRVEIPYRERAAFTPYHDRTQRWACIVAHRRAGKTVALINDLIDGATRCKLPNPRFAYIAPTYRQAKDVAWEYLKFYAEPIPGVQTNETELRVDFPGGGRVRLYGAENYDRLRGLALDGVVLDEPADMDPRVFPEVVRPALSDRGGWATWGGTPKGHNSFYDIAQHARKHPDEWFFLELRASETGILPAHELADAAKILTPEQYAQEYECSFEAAIVGSFYGKEMEAAQREGRIGNVPYDKFVQVSTWWDLGVSDATAIWFVQRAGMEIHLVDYHQGSGVGPDEYVRILEDKRREHGFQWGEHHFPHDIQARQWTTGGQSRLETIRGLGLQNLRVTPLHSVLDGINSVRRILPRCWFDGKRCEQGLEALRQYRTEYDEKNKIFRRNPLHNWASHGADAFRTGAAHIDDTSGKAPLRYKAKDREPTGTYMSA